MGYKFLTELTMSILSKSDEKAIELWEINRNNFENNREDNPDYKYSIGGCYTYFQSSFFKVNDTRKYYFAFQAMPLWTFDLIEEFNNIFTNIKIVPVKTLPIYLVSTKDAWGNNKAQISTKKYSDKDKELLQVLFTIELSPDYNKDTLVYLYYILHHLVRMISLGEGRVNDTKPNGSLLEHIFTISLHNTYRSLCEFRLTMDDFKKLDDIDRVNYYLNWTCFLTQTEIFINLLWDRFCQFPKGQSVIINSRYYHNDRPQRIIPEKLNKYGSVVGVSDSGKLTSAIIRNLMPDKLVPTNDGKFKIGDFVTHKVNYRGVLRGRVKELFDNKFMTVVDLTTNKDELGNQLFYKRIPKTQYRYYRIEG